MKKSYKVCTLAAVLGIIASGAVGLTSCGGFDGIMIWGPVEHEEIYLNAVETFRKSHPDFKAEVRYGSQGDAGAYANMAIDPQSGASLVTFPNDQLINLRRIGALGKLPGAKVDAIKKAHVVSSVEAGRIGDDYFAYPLSADNGFEFIYNRDAFKDTSVWDAEKDGLKDGYTFRDLNKALDERGAQAGHEKWADGLCIWPIGSAWYEAGVFFATGGDYKVEYDDKGTQTSASCTFGYETGADGKQDYTIGLEATRCMVNTFTNEDGTISKHFMYTGDNNPAYNDVVDKYSVDGVETPLAGIISWNNGALRKNWGDDYDVEILPTLESSTHTLGGTGNKYTWKTFSGFKLLGVNPYSQFASKSVENLTLLHDLAEYLSGTELSLERYNTTGLGPSNLEAQKNEEVKKDKFLTKLNQQYSLPDNKGFRVQDSTPSNFWSPIGSFGQGLFNAVKEGTKGAYDNEFNLKRTLKSLQSDIESAAK